MRRGRMFFYLAFLMILGLVAVAVIWIRFLQPVEEEPVVEAAPTPFVDLVNVIVVTQRIPRGSVLNETVLGMIPIQRDLVINGYYTDITGIVGRRAKVDLEANMLLTSGMVVDSSDQLSETGSNAALSIPRGMVALSIPINRLSSVSYAPQSGDHVNVIATILFVDLDTEFQTSLPNQNSAVLAPGPGVLMGMGTENNGSGSIDKEVNKVTAQNVTGSFLSPMGRTEIDPLLEQTFYVVPSEKPRPRLVSQTLLQDAVVLRLGNFDLPTQQAKATPTVEAEQPPSEVQTYAEVQEPVPPAPPDIITLIVTPQDAVTLNYLVYAGAQLTLALRSAGDDSRVQTEAATLDFLLKQYNIPVPVKLPYGFEPRVDNIIRPTLENDIVPSQSP